MASFSETTWLLIGGIGIAGILGMLAVLAANLRDRTQLMQLQFDVRRLQREYQERLDEMQRPPEAAVLVESEPAAPAPSEPVVSEPEARAAA